MNGWELQTQHVVRTSQIKNIQQLRI